MWIQIIQYWSNNIKYILLRFQTAYFINYLLTNIFLDKIMSVDTNFCHIPMFSNAGIFNVYIYHLGDATAAGGLCSQPGNQATVH